MPRCLHDMEEGTCSICLGLEVSTPRVPAVELAAAELFDFAASNPKWTKGMATSLLGWSEHKLTKVIRELRRILAGDDINLVVNFEAGEYLYQLVGDLEGALPWATIRLRVVEAQILTIADVTSSICNATKATTRDGRRARMIQAQVGILQMQLTSLEGT